MEKVIITGPTSIVGVALIQKFVQQGIQVTAICHRASKRISQIPKSELVQIEECNLDELYKLKDILDHDYDVFYHFAWALTVKSTRNNIDAQIVNLQYTLDAVEVAALLGCKKFIGVGSQAEYGRHKGALSADTPTFPEDGYGMAKLCAGQMSRLRCQQLGMEHIWTRVLSVYGPYDREGTMIPAIIRQLLKGEKPQCTKGEQIWDYIYSKDAAKAFFLLGDYGKNGKIYCLGSGKEISIREYISMIRNTIDERLEVGFGDVPYGDKQIMYLCADISELQKDTGFELEYSFERGIRETIDWYRKEYENES